MRFATMLLILVAVPAAAATYHVPSQYPTIQAGINAAMPGDLVLVADGTYVGAGNRDIDFLGKNIVVRSEHGAAATVIDCQGSSAAPRRGFFFRRGESNAAVLDGFTVMHGYATGGNYNGGGINCEGSSPTIRRCILRLNLSPDFGTDGGGICLRNSNAIVEDCSILENVGSYGGGMACRGSASPLIIRCVISGNVANYGDGIDAGGIGSPRIVDCLIIANETMGGFEDNGSGGGLILGGSASVSGCVVTGNRSGGGGGIACWSGSPSIVGCTIAGNYGQYDSGGGLFVSNSTPSFERTILWGNCADVSGDEILAQAGTATFSCCVVDSSGVVEQGGAVHYLPGNSFSDPLFCAPAACLSAPTPGGAYSVDRSSPAFPGENGCGEWIGALRVGCPPADAPENDQASGWQIDVPNPYRPGLPIRVPAGAKLSIYDVRGERLQNLDGAPAGVYFLRAQIGDQQVVRRVVLIR